MQRIAADDPSRSAGGHRAIWSSIFRIAARRGARTYDSAIDRAAVEQGPARAGSTRYDGGAVRLGRQDDSMVSVSTRWSTGDPNHGLYHDRAVAAERHEGGPKGGRRRRGRWRSTRSGVSAVIRFAAAGQGHAPRRRKSSAIVFGLPPPRCGVEAALRHGRDPGRSAAGNYSAASPAATAGAAHLAANRLRDKPRPYCGGPAKLRRREVAFC